MAIWCFIVATYLLLPLLTMPQPPVVLFDGVCNFCNSAVNIILKQDRRGRLRFGTLQSAAAQQLLHRQTHFTPLDSFVFVENGVAFQQSTAALKVLGYLPWYWQWTKLGWLLPRRLRDAAYNFIAARRYKWFGKRETCMLPTPAVKSRFLA